MELNHFAPVVIPTLDRYELLSKCLDSLERCTWAEKTEIYVALDYPPSEVYVEGWKKNDAYLKAKEQNNGFANLVVIRRERNYGVEGQNSNIGCLLNEIEKKYDSYILSEDDNIFSPNFLEYINKGLILFKEDPKVLAVCGYRFYYPIEFDDNNFIRQGIDFNFWGCGCWVDKMKQSLKWDFKTLSRKFLNPMNIYKVWKTGSIRMNSFLRRTYKRSFDYHDNFYSIYMILNNMHMIMPVISKVRNIGWDGSGQHCLGYSAEIINSHLSQDIDSEHFFDYCGTGWEFYNENRSIIIKNDYNKGIFVQTLLMIIYKYLSFVGLDKIVHMLRKPFIKG